jgi:Family of unknown function (DUF6459)
MTAAVVAAPLPGNTGRRPYLAPVPACEPPFDDELGLPAKTDRNLRAPATVATKTSARNAKASSSTSSGGAVLTAPRVRPTTIRKPGVPPWSSESDIGVRKTASEHLPPAGRAGSVLARALVEVLSGRRPLGQLRVHCAPDIYAGLIDRPPTGSLSLPHLLTVRVCEPADGIAEVSAAFRRSERVRALAFRLEGVDGRWRITALQVG